MSNIDKQAVQAVADLKAGYTLGHADVEIIQQMALDAVTLLDELEAKDSTIATQQQEIRTLLNALGQASEKRNAEQAGIIAKQEKWIKDVEETMISATDRAEAAEKRIADQSGIIESARKFISEYAGLGDVGAAEFVKIIDRAAAAGKGEAS
ncbi:hypothetical protein [Enterobacter kobei]|uniref:hypothetical protein n=1 Tax=Enterobacter kobei TaxID=208224 RepID=UPI000802758F|nr:hypothetical protein [Enterobacter kobei]